MQEACPAKPMAGGVRATPVLSTDIEAVKDRLNALDINGKKISNGGSESLAQSTDLKARKVDAMDVRSTSGIRGFDRDELAALDIG